MRPVNGSAAEDRPVDPGSLARTVYEQLKDDILWLKLPARTQLKEEILGHAHGASRSPVRQALRQLLDEGLVERNGRFYQVVEVSSRAMRDLYEVREALEKTAVRLCAERAEPGAIERLAGLIDEQAGAVKAGDLQRLAALDSAFHLAIAAASGNDYLLRQLSSVHDRVRLTRGKEQVAPGWPERVVVEHRRILNALERRDVAVGEAEMRYHIHSVVRLHLGLDQEPYAGSS